MEGTAGPRPSANPTSPSTSQDFAVDYVGWVSEGEARQLELCGRSITGTDGGLDKDGFVKLISCREGRRTGDYLAENEHRRMVGWAFGAETWKQVDPQKIRKDWDRSVAGANECLQIMNDAQWKMYSVRLQYNSTNNPNLKADYARQFHNEKRRWHFHRAARQAELQFQGMIRPAR